MKPTAPGGDTARPGNPPPERQDAPGGTNPGTPPLVPAVEQTEAALAAGDPESFYKAAQRFQAMADTFTNASERIRAQTTYLEQVWQGQGSRGFTDAMRDLNRTVDKLIETLSAPNYGSLINQLGDALTEAQRQVGQLKGLQQQGRNAFAGSSAAGDPTAQAALKHQETAHNEHSLRVLEQLSNTYYNIGKQLGQFPGKSVRGKPIVLDQPPPSPTNADILSSGESTLAPNGLAGATAVPMVMGGHGFGAPSYSAEQGVLGRQASTYGTSNSPTELHSAELNEHGVLVPPNGASERVAVSGGPAESTPSTGVPYGVNAAGLSMLSARSAPGVWTKVDNPADGENRGDADKSTQDDFGLERFGSPDGPQWSVSQDYAQPPPELESPPELTEKYEEPFQSLSANGKASEGVETEVVPTSTHSGPDAGGGPLPGDGSGGVTGKASAGPSVSIPSTSVPSVSVPSTSPALGQVPTSPPGSVASTSATVPTSSSSTAPSVSSGATPPTASSGTGNSAMPMAPIGGMGAAMGNQLGRDRFSSTLQHEDVETWDSSADITGGVLGR